MEIKDITKTLKNERFISWIKNQRWFLEKSKKIKNISVEDFWNIHTDQKNEIIDSLIKLDFSDKTREIYHIPLLFYKRGNSFSYTDATSFFNFHNSIIRNVLQECEISTFKRKKIHFRKFKENLSFRKIEMVKGEMSNTLTKLNGKIVKVFRKVKGINPEIEVLANLSQIENSPIPKLLGFASYNNLHSLLLIQEYIESQTDMWDYTTSWLEKFLKYTKTNQKKYEDKENHFLKKIKKMGETIALLHINLSKAFRKEKIKESDTKKWYSSLKKDFNKTIKMAKSKKVVIPEKEINEKIEEIKYTNIKGYKIRIHGDLHLDQILKTSDDEFFIIDFEGEPLRSYEEITAKYSPLRDVAGVIRSFDYAIWFVLLKNKEKMNEQIQIYRNRIVDIFLDGYMSFLKKQKIKLFDEKRYRHTLSLFTLEKALYELRYEMNSRPSWINIPLYGIKECLEM